MLPTFLEERGFTAEISGFPDKIVSDKLTVNNRIYYRDYVAQPRPSVSVK